MKNHLPVTSDNALPSNMPFTRRALLPVAVALFVWIVLYMLNSLPIPLEPRGLYRFLKNAFLILFYADIWLSSALFVYPYMYFHGSNLRERILASFVLPVAYILSEILRVSEYFTPGEALYYGLSTMGLLTLSLQVGLLAVAEITCRWRGRARTGLPQRVITLGPVVALIFMLAAVYVLLLWGMGVHWFYIYQEGYKILFAR